MAVWQAVLALIETLKTIPPDIVPTNHIGVVQPSSVQQLPALVITTSEVSESPIGVGGVIGTQQVAAEQWAEATGKRISGQLLVDIWAQDEEGARQTVNTLFQTVANAASSLRSQGFVKLTLGTMSSLKAVQLNNQPVITMTTKYIVIHEAIETNTVGPGGLIRHIRVRIEDQFDEELDLS